MKISSEEKAMWVGHYTQKNGLDQWASGKQTKVVV